MNHTLTSPVGDPLAVARGRNAGFEPATPPAVGKEPPGPPDTPFAALLDDHQARTAVAEGHRRADPAAGAPRDDDATPAQPGSPDAGPPDAGSLAALLGGVPLPADATVAVLDAAAGSVEPEPVGGLVLSAPAARTRVSDAGTCTLTSTRPSGDAGSLAVASAAAWPELPAGPAAPATASSPSVPLGLGAAESRSHGSGAAAAAPSAAIARAASLADVLQAARPATAADPPATLSPATVAGAGRVQADANGHASAQAVTPVMPATPTAAPATPAVPTPAPPASAAVETAAGPGRAVGLDRAVETVRLALRAGAERGVTHARISLTPRELGSIDVHLRQTADGLVARVVAQHAVAAQLLQDAGADLRRQLEQSGLTLLRLDVGASGEHGGRAADRRASASGDGVGDGHANGRRSGDAGDDPLAALDGATDTTTSTTTLTLPNGALVDVLA